jgi:dTMP kinase
VTKFAQPVTDVLISFEGPEGGGKSTQSALLMKSLETAAHVVRRTREPGGTNLGDGVRTLLLDPRMDINSLAEFLLFSASRAQHVTDVIKPALQEGIVITDRYYDSSLAYQGYGRGLDLKFLKKVTKTVVETAVPHLTILLDIDPRLGLERAAATGAPDRLERADLEFHKKVRAGFLDIALKNKSRFLVVDAAQSIGVIQEQIWQEVTRRFLS